MLADAAGRPNPFARPRTRGFAILLIWLAGLAVSMAASAAAAVAEAPADFDGFGHTVFTARTGAPSNVNALAQADDGFLWVGTSQGLYRFDGVRFMPWRAASAHPLPDTNVTALLPGADGEVWVGTRFGHVYAIRGTDHREYGEAQGLPPHTVTELAADGAGRIFASTGHGVFVLRGSRWEEVRARDGRSLHVMGYSAMVLDRDGRLWAVSPDSGIYCLEPGASSFDKRREDSSLSGQLIKDAAGDVWVSDDTGLASLSVPGRWLPMRELRRQGAGHTANTMLRFLDRDGVLWGQNFGALMRLPCAVCGGTAGPLQRWPRERELSGNEMTSWLQDREGNLWIGTNGGLDRFHRNKFDRATVDGMQLGNVALAMDGPDLVVATYTQGLYRRGPGGRFVREPPSLPAGSYVLMLYKAGDSALWVGGTDLLLRRRGTGSYQDVPFQGPQRDYLAQAMAEDQDGGLWLSAAHAGVYRWKGGRWTLNGGLAQLPAGAALSLQSDLGHGLWIGYPNGRVAIVRDERVRLLGQADSLAVGNVTAFLPEGAGMWVAGSAGVALVRDGQIHALLDPQGESFKGVTGLVRAGNGDLWLNGASGVLRIARAKLVEFLAQPGRPVVAELFGVQAGIDGAPEGTNPLPSAMATPDGRLWFVTSNGLFSINPDDLRRNVVAPQIHLLSVSAGGRELPVAAEVALPPAVHAFQLDYTATSLTAPELVRFRYRLDGVDTDWQDAKGRRQAFYTNLAPGRYVFRVTAVNEDGVPSSAERSMTLVLQPAFWQTAWFRTLCALLGVALIWAAVRFRTAVWMRRLRDRYEVRLRERERIARELHDTLLQGTQGLVLGFQVAAGKLPAGDPRRREMEAILDRADEVVAEARDRVQGLRGNNESDIDLATALAALVHDLGAGKPPRVKTLIDPDLPPLREEVSGELLCIGREAITNAFQHAKASTIALELVCDRRGLRLSIHDDGIGMEPGLLAQGRPGHFGLLGIRERASRIGAALDLHSEPGRGTQIVIRLPARLAFDSRGRDAALGGRGWRAWWRWLMQA